MTTTAPQTGAPAPTDPTSVAAGIDVLVANGIKALAEYASRTQEDVNHYVKKASVAALNQHGVLALQAVKETGRGVFEDKAVKNIFACEHVTHSMAPMKTVGIISEDPITGITEIAEPVGVIAGITPVTNPTSTAIFKALIAIKTRNPIIFGFHPSARECSIAAAKVVRDAAVEAGAPEHCVQWIEIPSLEATGALMNHPDVSLILATGGNAMVKAAYSCGKPALGVGAGNVPAYVHKSANLKRAINDLVISKAFDNGMVCASEQAVILDKEIYDEAMALFDRLHAYQVTKDEKAKLEEFIFGVSANGVNCAGAKLNPNVVGKSPQWIAEQAGFKVPDETSIILAECAEVGENEPLTREKLAPVLAVLKANDTEQGLHLRREDGGVPRTRPLRGDPRERRRARQGIRQALQGDPHHRQLSLEPRRHRRHLQRVPALAHARLWLVRQELGVEQRHRTEPHQREAHRPEEQQHAVVQGSRQDLLRAQRDPVLARHERRRARHDRHRRDDDPHRRGRQDHRRAASPLEQHLAADHRQRRARAVHQDGHGRCGDHAGLQARHDHRRRRRLADGRREGHVAHVRAPRHRVLRPQGEVLRRPQARVPVPQAGRTRQAGLHPDHVGHRRRGDAVRGHHRHRDGPQVPARRLRAHAHRRDHRPGPHGQPACKGRGRLRDGRADARHRGVCLGLRERLHRRSVPAGDPPGVREHRGVGHRGWHRVKAREKMHNAATIAGMAFGNAFLGLVHAMCHVTGSMYHVAHGRTNAIYLPHVIRYNGKVPTKPTSWPKQESYVAPERFQDIAKMLGLAHETPEIAVEAYATAVEELRAKLGIEPSFQAAGVDETEFIAASTPSP